MALLFPLLLLAVMYVFLILPQRKRSKAHAELLRAVSPGDEILTSGGIYGGVTEIDGDDLYLEIAPDVEIKINRRAVSERISGTTTAAAPATDVVVPDEVIEDADPIGLPEGVSDGGDDTPEKGAKKK
jgi:preprotein translocase YajC subunit